MQNQPQFHNFGPGPAPARVVPPFRKDVMKTVLLLIAVLIFTNILSGAAGAVMGILSAFTGFQMNSLIGTFLSGMFPIMITEIICVFVACRMFKLPFSTVIGKTSVNPGFTALASFGCIGLGVIGQIISIVFMSVLELLHVPVYVPDIGVDWSQPLGSILLLVYVCLIGPVMEELIFRGVMLRTLQKYGAGFAILYTSILFAIFHQNVGQIFVPLLLGVFFSMLTIRTGSIIPAVAAHVANNCIAMLLDSLLPTDNPVLYAVGYIIYALIFLGAGAVFMILYRKEFDCLRKMQPEGIKLGAQMKSAFTHWPTIVVMVMYAGTLILTSVLALIQDHIS